MPYPMIPAILGSFFLLIWVCIGAMVVRDCQLDARRQRELEEHLAHRRHALRRRTQRHAA